MPYYGRTSEKNLSECTPNIQKVFREVIKYYDNSVIEGHRGQAEQNEKFRTNLTDVKYPFSKHNQKPSKGIDATPYPIPKEWGRNNVKELVKFYQFASVVLYEAKKLGIELRWGGDWDGDGDYTDQTFDDLVHFEEA